MKNLKVNDILLSLLTMLVITLFATSCSQSELVTDEIPEANLTKLAERLADNPNFQASIEIHEKIGNDLMKFIADNNVDATKDDVIITDFISSYIISDKEFALYRTNLLNDIPELHSITEQVFKDAVSLAQNLIGKQELTSRNCSDTYQFCAQAAYLKYYYGYSSYFVYFVDYSVCIQQYYVCI